MTTKKKGGRPTRQERREQQLADALTKFSDAIELQSKALDKLLNQKEAGQGQVQARTIDASEEFANVAKPTPPGEPGVIYKSGSRGLRMVLRRSKKVHNGDDYEIVPPVVADFDNSTFRTSDPEVIAMLDAKIEFRKRRGLPPRIVKIKDERLVEELSSPGADVKPVGDGSKQPEMPDWALPPTGTA